MSTDRRVEDQVLPLLAAIEQDPETLPSELPQVLGQLLCDRVDGGSLRHLRSELAETAKRIEGEQAHGGNSGEAIAAAAAVSVLTDVLTGYLDKAEQNADISDEVTSPLRRQIMDLLAKQSARSSNLADQLGKARPQISTALGELTRQELVEYEVDSEFDGRSRRYQLTAKGRQVLVAT